MKKTTSVLLVVLLLLFPLSSFAQEFSFRNGITFGMDKNSIVNAEGKEPLVSSETTLIYSNQTSAGKQCAVAYGLQNNALVSINVIFSEEHSYDNLYIEDFEDVDKALSTKYGAAYRPNFYHWKNDLYKNKPEEHGFAVSCGHLEISSAWKFDDFMIIHALFGDNFTLTHAIRYEIAGMETKPNTDGI